jgi:uncharacterized protein
MKIRSITYFINPAWPLNQEVLHQAGQFIQAAKTAYELAGFEVQTTRLATVPFPQLAPSLKRDELIELAQSLEAITRHQGFDYFSLGPALPDQPKSYDHVADMLAATSSLFLAGMLTTPEGGVSLPAVRACAAIIHKVARLSQDGFTNLRFGAAANVSAGGPFLPVAYLDPTTKPQDAPIFALAIEAADLAVIAVSQADSLQSARMALIQAVEENAARLVLVARSLTEAGIPVKPGVRFGGIDFTLAPFPQLDLSFGTAMERLGVPSVGLHGSLAAAAFLTNSLDQAQFPRAGFNGLMLPLLEDAVLAARAAEGNLTLMDLLMYSAVCGTGLDTLPLPGDIHADQLAAILLDVAALSQRLAKPLIARLMPIPGKAAGDLTEFDFPYFANSRVLDVRSAGLHGFFSGDETFSLSQF